MSASLYLRYVRPQYLIGSNDLCLASKTLEPCFSNLTVHQNPKELFKKEYRNPGTTSRKSSLEWNSDIYIKTTTGASSHDGKTGKGVTFLPVNTCTTGQNIQNSFQILDNRQYRTIILEKRKINVVSPVSTLAFWGGRRCFLECRARRILSRSKLSCWAEKTKVGIWGEEYLRRGSCSRRPP